MDLMHLYWNKITHAVSSNKLQELPQLPKTDPFEMRLYFLSVLFQDEDEVDQGTMVRAGTGDSGTIRAAGSLGSTARTMIEHGDTGTMQSQLGTMVINSDDEDEEEAGTMKSKTQKYTHTYTMDEKLHQL